jgi:hypothetical protein
VKRLALLALLVGCTNDVDPPWQIDHQRVIAVRATPSGIVTGETSKLDALLGRAGDIPLEAEPEMVEVISPMALAGAVSRQGTSWFATAPADLTAARAELMLMPTDPVPLRLRMTFPDFEFVGIKAVLLGEHHENPSLGTIRIGDEDKTTATRLVVPKVTDVRLDVDFDDTFTVNWLTSCGNMHDYDLPGAYLRVEPEDPQDGMLGLVVRDSFGGVAWKLWQISAE